MRATPTLPGWLETDLRKHGRTHELYYNGFLADHLPMAAMALYALGGSQEAIRDYTKHYRERLVPLRGPAGDPVESFEKHVGERAAYPGLLACFDRQVARDGAAATVRAVLPSLLSGWVADAYHAIIRLAYGLRFGSDAEVAAGLAYMAACGPDPKLAAQADQIREGTKLPKPESMGGFIFLQKYEGALRSGRLPRTAGALPADVRGIAEFALDAFNATHDFFALHLVTGTHAFDICSRYLEADALPMLRAGVAAGYLAIGAPRFEPGNEPTPAQIDDEHDTKLAFACADLAEHFGSRKFEAAARVYRPAGLD